MQRMVKRYESQLGSYDLGVGKEGMMTWIRAMAMDGEKWRLTEYILEVGTTRFIDELDVGN